MTWQIELPVLRRDLPMCFPAGRLTFRPGGFICIAS